MWLTPNSSSIASSWSARSCRIDPSAAAPKMTRLLSCPVRPKVARSIMVGDYPGPRAAGQVGEHDEPHRWNMDVAEGIGGTSMRLQASAQQKVGQAGRGRAALAVQ